MSNEYVPGDNADTVRIKTLNSLNGSGSNAYVPGDNEDTVRIKILGAILAGGGGGGIPDAPIDGKEYARKNGGWSEVTLEGGASRISMSAENFYPGVQTWEKIPFDHMDYDQLGVVGTDPVDGILNFTIEESGRYIINGVVVLWDFIQLTRVLFSVWVNGAEVSRLDDGPVATSDVGNSGLASTAIVKLTAGDQVDIYFWCADNNENIARVGGLTTQVTIAKLP